MTLKAARLIVGLLFGVSIFLAPFIVQRLHAQVLYGSLTGAVTDQTGAVLPGAQVAISNDRTGLKRQSTTDSTGRYRVLDLPEGTYTIEVSATGFKPLKKTNIAVTIGQVNAEDLQLQVGALSQEVTVQGSATVLQTEKSDVHTTISSFAIDNLPTDPYRNFQTVELLAPGVFSDSQITKSYPNSYADTPERSLNIDANGLPPRINTTRVDGATNLFIWLPNHMLVIPPQDTIQEVNVQTSNYDVEKGLTAGVATDVVTKSGTNELHGTLYGFHSDNALDASNVFYPGNLPKAKHIVNQDGGTVGGPIQKNKLFFFANWEGLFERNNYSASATLPPVADGSTISNWRGGDFSSSLGAPLFDALGNPINVCTTGGGITQLQEGMVFDPTSGNPDGSGRCVFSSGGILNVVPSNLLNPGATAFNALIPTPNYFPQGHVFNSNTSSNYFISTTDKATRQIFGGRLDWNQSDKHAIWGHYMGQNFNFADPAWYGQAGGGYSTGNSHQFATTMTVGHTWTLSPTTVLTGHVGFTRMSENSRPPSFGKALGESLLGIPGSNAPDGDPLYTGLPGVYITGFDTLGDANSWQPVFRNDWTATTSHNVTWVRHTHEIRFGVDVSHNHLNHWQPEIFCCPRGYVNFYPDNTGLDMPIDAAYDQMPVFTKVGGTLTSAGTGFSTDRQNSVAAFDLGVIGESFKSRQFIKNTAKDTQFGLYVGDRWKATPKFTVDVGVRYEYFPLIVRDGAIKFERYDPSTNETLLGGVGGNPVHLGATSSKKLFMPRLGLAYRLDQQTVLRGGFGLSNDTLPLERPLRGFFPLSLGADNLVPSTNFSAWQPLGTFAQGIPLLPDPNISSGAIVAPNTVDVGTLGPGEFKRAYIESWNLFVERQLPGEFLLDVGYVGNHYVHEMNGRDLNAATLGGGAASQPLFTAFARTAGTYQFQGYLGSHYNSLQVALNRHFSKGLYVQGSYTWSKVISYTSDNSWENALTFSCPPSPALPQGCQEHNRGVAGFDHMHMLKMAYVYELPLGAGKKWANSERVSRAILGGWQVNGVFSGWTGPPLTLTASGSRLHTPGTTQTPNEVAAIKYPKGQGPGQFWFDTTAFAPVLTNNVLGTVGRNPSWLRGPGLVQMDTSLFRHFKITERYDLEVRAEAQNLTNSPHFNNPGRSCTNINGACGGSFGQITAGYGERYVQLGLKLRF
jgi:carboxypeptidase family protein/TonB-dependent receptor-like protein